MDLLYDTLFNGLAIGSVLVLAALGLAVVFGLMGVINMAHGELMMLGAYTTFVVQNISRLCCRKRCSRCTSWWRSRWRFW